jgi:hypothetical protein
LKTKEEKQLLFPVIILVRFSYPARLQTLVLFLYN